MLTNTIICHHTWSLCCVLSFHFISSHQGIHMASPVLAGQPTVILIVILWIRSSISCQLIHCSTFHLSPTIYRGVVVCVCWSWSWLKRSSILVIYGDLLSVDINLMKCILLYTILSNNMFDNLTIFHVYLSV